MNAAQQPVLFRRLSTEQPLALCVVQDGTDGNGSQDPQQQAWTVRTRRQLHDREG
jgi:hypothetical protein